MRTVALTLAAALLAGVPAITADAGWNWRGAVSGGSAVEIRGVTGDIRALPSQSGQVEVSAVLENGEAMEIHVIPGHGGLTFCAVRKGGDACSDGLLTGRVDYRVRVPAGVKLVARTVNGAIEASDMASDIHASTVNGGVIISTTGTASASTVNGSIEAILLGPFGTQAPQFSAVNGGISVAIPDNLRGGVKAETKNGKIVSKMRSFRGAVTDQTLDGTFGRAGAGAGNPLIIKTINGAIELKTRT